MAETPQQPPATAVDLSGSWQDLRVQSPAPEDSHVWETVPASPHPHNMVQSTDPAPPSRPTNVLLGAGVHPSQPMLTHHAVQAAFMQQPNAGEKGNHVLELCMVVWGVQTCPEVEGKTHQEADAITLCVGRTLSFGGALTDTEHPELSALQHRCTAILRGQSC